MILVAESGSTKTEWFLEGKSEAILTKGINPFFLSSSKITELLSDSDLNGLCEKVSEVYFFGPGCAYPEHRAIVREGIQQYFHEAKKIFVGHDLEAAAYALYDGEPCICGILGTGSNTCFFDGQDISQATPSLAWILGDEGSGNHMGKRLLRAWVYKQLPESLAEELETTYKLTVKDLMDAVYHSPAPANTYLASFMPFIHEHRSAPAIRAIIDESFHAFFKNHIINYENYQKTPLHLVGSIAHYFREELYENAANYGIQIRNILQKPGKNLAKAVLSDQIPVLKE
ncbi:MAG TPA: hypothetical protein VJ917_08610 [Saprospiraceae bacterium]|nr:hypothetical protein [Saprospiraceae bacterium]